MRTGERLCTWSHCEHGGSRFSGGLWKLWDLWIKGQKPTRHVTSDTAGSQGSNGVMRSLSISRLLFSMLASFSGSPPTPRVATWPQATPCLHPTSSAAPVQREPLSPLVPFRSPAWEMLSTFAYSEWPEGGSPREDQGVPEGEVEFKGAKQ